MFGKLPTLNCLRSNWLLVAFSEAITAFIILLLCLKRAIMHASASFARVRTNHIAGLLLAAVALAAPAYAQSQPSALLAQKSSTAAELVATAEQQGHVSVIVQLALPMSTPELQPDPLSLQVRKSQISAAQDSLITTHFGDANNPKAGFGFPRALRKFEISPLIVLNITKNELESLAADTRVTGIFENAQREANLAQTVPLIGMPSAYSQGATGSGMAVAIIDDAVQSDHPFLSGKVILEQCYSNSVGTGVSTCPNGSTQQSGAGSASATNAACMNGSNSICRHGTGMAGTAAGFNTVSDSFPPNGVAKNAKIVAIKVSTRINSGSCGSTPAPCTTFYDGDILAGLDFVYQNQFVLPGSAQFAAANMSLGGGQYTSACDNVGNGSLFKTKMDNLRSANIAPVVAAGNDGFTNAIEFPACISSAIAVGASTKQDGLSPFSNMSSQVALIAPGGTNLSTCQLNDSNSVIVPAPIGTYVCGIGTSGATAHVSGAWAAIKSALPNASVNQILSALQNHGPFISGKRRIQVDQAAQEVISGGSAATMVVDPTGAQTFTCTQGATFCTPTLAWYRISASNCPPITCGGFNFVVSGKPDWMDASPLSGGVGSSGFTEVDMVVNATGRAKPPGTYTATLTFTNTTNGQGNTTRSVTLTVNSGGTPTLAVSPASNIASSGNQGGPFSPSSFQFQLSATSGSINYSISGTPNWLTPSGTSGTVTASPTTVTFTVNTNANGFAPGTYGPTTITFTNSTNGQGNTSRSATLTVNPAGGTPANDNFASAITLSGQSGSTTGTNVGATLQSGEPAAYAGTGTHTVWWKWTAPATAQATFGTAGSSFDTVLTAYTGSAVNALTLAAGNDDFNGTLQSSITFQAQAGVTYYIRIDGFSPSDTGSIALAWSQTGGASTSIVAAVAPTARTTTINNGVTAYATIINAGSATATSCSIALPAGVPANFLYQATNSSGSPIGSPNTPVDIAAGQPQGFYFLITPTQAMQQDINLVFDCTNTAPAPVYPGINQFRLSAAASQSADVLLASATAPDFGLMDMASPSGSGFFAVAAVNIGPSASITFTPTYTPIGQPTHNLPLNSTICYINPSNGACISPPTPGPSVTLTVATGQVVNFGVFVTGQGTFIPLDLANNRVLVVAQQGTTPLSQTSVAVHMLSGGDAPALAQVGEH